MKTQIDRDASRDAILVPGDGDGAFAAWTLEELGEELGSLRPAFAGSDDAGS